MDKKSFTEVTECKACAGRGHVHSGYLDPSTRTHHQIRCPQCKGYRMIATTTTTVITPAYPPKFDDKGVMISHG